MLHSCRPANRVGHRRWTRTWYCVQGCTALWSALYPQEALHEYQRMQLDEPVRWQANARGLRIQMRSDCRARCKRAPCAPLLTTQHSSSHTNISIRPYKISGAQAFPPIPSPHISPQISNRANPIHTFPPCARAETPKRRARLYSVTFGKAQRGSRIQVQLAWGGGSVLMIGGSTTVPAGRFLPLKPITDVLEIQLGGVRSGTRSPHLPFSSTALSGQHTTACSSACSHIVAVALNHSKRSVCLPDSRSTPDEATRRL